MAKTPKVKKRGVSMHSRAARRAASPSLDVDKSLLALKPPVDTSNYTPKVLGVQSGGISKKKNGKAMTRHQRLRHQKGLQRADMVNDKMETKVEKSAVKGKRTKDRAADWEDLNEKITTKPHAKAIRAAQPVEQDAALAELDSSIDKAVGAPDSRPDAALKEASVEEDDVDEVL